MKTTKQKKRGRVERNSYTGRCGRVTFIRLEFKQPIAGRG